MPRIPASLRTAALLLFITFHHPAMAQDGPLVVDITKATIEPIPFAITLDVEDTLLASEATDIAGIVANDLQGSALFRRIDPAAYLQDAASAAEEPRFSEWRIIDSQILLAGTIRGGDGVTMVLDVRVWDVYGQREMAGIRLNGSVSLARRMAHVVADRIYTRLTGEEGYFDTRILYVAESGPATERVKRLAIMDQDGANHATSRTDPTWS